MRKSARTQIPPFFDNDPYSVVLYLRHIEFQDSDYQGGFQNFSSGGGRCVCVCVCVCGGGGVQDH